MSDVRNSPELRREQQAGAPREERTHAASAQGVQAEHAVDPNPSSAFQGQVDRGEQQHARNGLDFRPPVREHVVPVASGELVHAIQRDERQNDETHRAGPVQ